MGTGRSTSCETSILTAMDDPPFPTLPTGAVAPIVAKAARAALFPRTPLRRSSQNYYSKYRQINSEGCKMRTKEEAMKAIRIPPLDPEQLDALEKLYRTTRNTRLRTRAQMVLLAAERRLTAAEIAEIVRTSEETVR